jgi:glycosyltransferase involved in cell wall biosynthesis
MPRIGMNPNRGLKTSQLQARITLAALTYLPEEIGYFEHRFDVTRLCLESLIANTPQIYDLLVFDNGSCPLLVNYLEQLHAAGKIHYLLLSKKNIGKIAALQMICKAAPGEIIAYSDDDVFFLPGWLEAHLQIMDSYPKVGLVTGFYIRSHMRYATRSLERFAGQEDVQVERGNLVPVAVEQHYVENRDAPGSSTRRKWKACRTCGSPTMTCQPWPRPGTISSWRVTRSYWRPYRMEMMAC